MPKSRQSVTVNVDYLRRAINDGGVPRKFLAEELGYCSSGSFSASLANGTFPRRKLEYLCELSGADYVEAISVPNNNRTVQIIPATRITPDNEVKALLNQVIKNLEENKTLLMRILEETNNV